MWRYERRYPYRVLCSVLVLVTAASASIAGQAAPQAAQSSMAAATYTTPRTPWGDPNLQRTWRPLGTPLERPEGTAVDARRTPEQIKAATERFEKVNALRLAGKGESRGFRANPNMNDIWVAQVEKPRYSTRLWGVVDPPDLRLPPWTLEQLKRWEFRLAETAKHGDADTLRNRTYGERCISHYPIPALNNWGLEFGGRTSTFGGRFEILTEERVVTFMDGLNSNVSGNMGRIIQAPGWVVIMDPEYDSFRFIPLGKRETLGQGIRSWRGDTYGYFEGDTLVIEVTNIFYEYPVIPGYRGGGMYPGTGEKLKVVENYRRTGPESFLKTYTVTDPDVYYVQPYTVVVEGFLDNSFKDLPSICHEVNLVDMGGLLATARLDEAAAWENMREIEVELAQWFDMRKQQALDYANRAKTQSSSGR